MRLTRAFPAFVVGSVAVLGAVGGCSTDPGISSTSGGGATGGSGGTAGSGATGGGGGPSGTGGSGGGFQVSFPDAGASAAGGAGGPLEGENCGQLVVLVRDFQDSHPDFERFSNKYLEGIVEANLGADGRPVYAHPGPTSATSSGMAFSEWYRDVAGKNMRLSVPLPLVPNAAGVSIYDSNAFFPIDGKGFGNQGRAHNFHFTTEIRGKFTYQGGERFTFKGDDDIWVFVNGRLALDLGGSHAVLTKTIDFDGQAAALGIARGRTYNLDVFHAERHTSQSNFRIETSIKCLRPQIE